MTLPDTGTELAARCGLSVVAVADSVESATRSALDAVGSGGVVLLSPAAPTPARIGNWQTRSDQFRAALSALALPTATPTPPD